MRSASWAVLLLALGGCVAKARTTPASPRMPAQAIPPPPVWTEKASPPTPDLPVRIAAWEEVPSGDPERLVRDLADAKACAATRTELARLVATGLARVRPALSAAAVGQVRSGLERTVVPGCAIARRECRDDGRERRWCWSEGVLDSSVARAWVRRELLRIDPARAEALVSEIFRAGP